MRDASSEIDSAFHDLSTPFSFCLHVLVIIDPGTNLSEPTSALIVCDVVFSPTTSGRRKKHETIKHVRRTNGSTRLVNMNRYMISNSNTWSTHIVPTHQKTQEARS
jgi:hypothetical protein